MHITLVHVRVKSEAIDAFIAATRANHEASIQEDGNRRFDVLQSPDDPARYVGLIDSLVPYDRFLVCADFDAYWEAQRRVEALWREPELWWRSAVLNSARMGWFSSDRTIREYATEIWKALE